MKHIKLGTGVEILSKLTEAQYATVKKAYGRYMDPWSASESADRYYLNVPPTQSSDRLLACLRKLKLPYVVTEERLWPEHGHPFVSRCCCTGSDWHRYTPCDWCMANNRLNRGQPAITKPDYPFVRS